MCVYSLRAHLYMGVHAYTCSEARIDHGKSSSTSLCLFLWSRISSWPGIGVFLSRLEANKSLWPSSTHRLGSWVTGIYEILSSLCGCWDMRASPQGYTVSTLDQTRLPSSNHLGCESVKLNDMSYQVSLKSAWNQRLRLQKYDTKLRWTEYTLDFHSSTRDVSQTPTNGCLTRKILMNSMYADFLTSLVW